MTLATLIRKGGLQQIATAISATAATHDKKGDDWVAKIATVAIADSPRQKAAILLLAQWDADDWRQYFDERAGIGEHEGRLSRADAERLAYEACISRWMSLNPPGGHLCVSDKMTDSWLALRRDDAIAALAGMDILNHSKIE